MQDLVVRGFCVVLGAVWAGFAYVALDGNPFVMAAFALVFMIPMLYRFTQSSHPVSLYHPSQMPRLTSPALRYRGIHLLHRHLSGS
jgi:hypothetical protein